MPDQGTAPNKSYVRTDGTRTGGTTWQDARDASVKIRADAHDTHDSDVATALNNRLMKDGGNKPTADIDFGSNTLTNLRAATARGEVARIDEVQDGAPFWGGTAGGTADALTISVSPTLTGYSAGQIFFFIAASDNTGSATLDVDSQGAQTFKKTDGSTNLEAGDIKAGRLYAALYDGTNLQLLNENIVEQITVLDEDDFSSDSATQPPSQQSTSAYIDDQILGVQTIWQPSAGMIPRTTNGAEDSETELATNDIMVKGLAFDKDTDEAAQFYIAMPKGWNESTVTAVFFWTASSGSGNVVWGLRARAFGDNDALDASWGTAQTVTDGLHATDDLMISSETSAITIGGSPAENDMVIFEVYRDANNGSDTHSDDAILLGVKILYTTNAATDD